MQQDEPTLKKKLNELEQNTGNLEQTLKRFVPLIFKFKTFLSNFSLRILYYILIFLSYIHIPQCQINFIQKTHV